MIAAQDTLCLSPVATGRAAAAAVMAPARRSANSRAPSVLLAVGLLAAALESRDTGRLPGATTLGVFCAGSTTDLVAVASAALVVATDGADGADPSAELPVQAKHGKFGGGGAR